MTKTRRSARSDKKTLTQAEIAAQLSQKGCPERHPQKKEMSFRKELSQTSSGTRNEQPGLSGQGESRAQRGFQPQSAPKETLQVEYNSWNQERSGNQQEIDEEITRLQGRRLKSS